MNSQAQTARALPPSMSVRLLGISGDLSIFPTCNGFPADVPFRLLKSLLAPMEVVGQAGKQ